MYNIHIHKYIYAIGYKYIFIYPQYIIIDIVHRRNMHHTCACMCIIYTYSVSECGLWLRLIKLYWHAYGIHITRKFTNKVYYCYRNYWKSNHYWKYQKYCKCFFIEILKLSTLLNVEIIKILKLLEFLELFIHIYFYEIS